MKRGKGRSPFLTPPPPLREGAGGWVLKTIKNFSILILKSMLRY